MSGEAKPGVFVIGPSYVNAHSIYRTAIQTTGEKPHLSARREFALGIRKLGVPAIIMEDVLSQAGEKNVELFRRIVDETPIRSFAVYWPLGARNVGLEIELGFLLDRLAERSLSAKDVVLVAERGTIEIAGEATPEPVFAFDAQGERSRYHEDLVAYGCPQLMWSTHAQLLNHVFSVADGHLRRHVGYDEEWDPPRRRGLPLPQDHPARRLLDGQ